MAQELFVVDDDTICDMPTARMMSWARNSTISRLGRKMMTERELFDAIIRKAKQKFDGITETQLTTVARSAVSFAYEINGLNDVAYSEISTRSGVHSGKSKRMMAQKLSAKGIDKDTATTALEESNDLFAAIVFARKRGFGPFRRGEPDDRRKLKELSAFARNGFGFEIGKTVFSMSTEEAEQIIRAERTI